MAEYGKQSGRKGNALKDGYTCIGQRPRNAAPGVLMSEDKAAEFDDRAGMMGKYGGRNALLHERFRDHPQNTVPPDDQDQEPWW